MLSCCKQQAGSPGVPKPCLEASRVPRDDCDAVGLWVTVLSKPIATHIEAEQTGSARALTYTQKVPE